MKSSVYAGLREAHEQTAKRWSAGLMKGVLEPQSEGPEGGW